MIHIKQLALAFAEHKLYDNLQLHIPPKARLGLVGDNGTGKTTLLKMILGEVVPDSGEIRMRPNLSPGYLPQQVREMRDIPLLEYVLSQVRDIRKLEERIDQLNHEMADLDPGSEQTEQCLEELGRLQHKLDHAGGYTMGHHAEKMLTGMGFSEGDFNRSLAQFSGGWQMRALLVKLLLEEPDLLLMDEPTNHLDLPAMEWLERYLRSFPGAVLVVSHDRYFLDRVVNTIAEIQHRRLTLYPGNYSQYREQKEKDHEKLLGAYQRQQDKIAELKRFIERFRYKASKASQVQSRVKMLEKIELIEVDRETSGISFHFPPAPRSGEIVLEAKQLAKSYGEKRVFDDLNFQLTRWEKVALVGRNGAGKSTLSRLISGNEPATAGELAVGYNTLLEYYSQDLESEMDPRNTVLEEVTEVAGSRSITEVRTLLGHFLFSGDSVYKKVEVLSGGEKSRLAICRMLFKKSNFLVLDEPTNHLDLKAKQVLQQAISDYAGTVLIVSHDRYFLDRIVTRVLSFEDNELRDYPGNYTEFLRAREERLEGIQAERQDDVSTRAPSYREQKKQRSLEKMARNKLLRGTSEKVEKYESEIAAIEKAMRKLEATMMDPSAFEDSAESQKMLKKYHGFKERLSILEPKWEKAMAAHEELEEQLKREDNDE